jgi:hypothetical protein
MLIFDALITVLGIRNSWGVIHYTISVTCKDGRYKFKLDGFYHEYYRGSAGEIINGEKRMPFGYRKKDYEDLKEQTRLESLRIIFSLKAAKNKATTAQADW